MKGYWSITRCATIMFCAIFVFSSSCFADSKEDAVNAIAKKIAMSIKPKSGKSTGEILRVKGDTVYIEFSQNEGVMVGDKFKIIRFGEAIALKGKPSVREEAEIGLLEITGPRDGYFIGKVIESTANPTEGDNVLPSSGGITRVALMEINKGEDLFRR